MALKYCMMTGKKKQLGEKFADCDLIGIPTRIVISERTLKNNSVEVKQRDKNKFKLIKLNQIKLNQIKSNQIMSYVR